MTKIKCIQKAALFLCLALLSTGCTKKTADDNAPSPTATKTEADTSASPITKSSFKLNTIVTITIYDSQDTSLLEGALKLCDSYEALLSRTIDGSEIDRLNRSGTNGFEVSDETVSLIKTGLHYSELSGGAFDITVAPLTSLWNFSATPHVVPDLEKIKIAVSEIGWEKVSVDNKKITFHAPTMGIDLGAIAKGYIADRIKDYLLENGVQSAMINLGGNLLLIGEKPDHSKFRVGIQKPFEGYNETIAIMQLSDVSIVSSGIYERYFYENDVLYHHILDPRTGYPYDNGLISVTIISEQSVDGDALSTTAFALGLEKGMDLIDSLDNVYAVFITDDDTLHYSKGFLENIPTVEE